MRKKVSIGFGAGAVLLIIAGGEGMNMLLNFLLAGVVPGTHYVAPYWLMMAVYCALIALLITDAIEPILKFIYGQRKTAAVQKTHMPRRRYGQL